jgi:hypothetical protein
MFNSPDENFAPTRDKLDSRSDTRRNYTIEMAFQRTFAALLQFFCKTLQMRILSPKPSSSESLMGEGVINPQEL